MHKPLKYSNTNILRCILLNINDGENMTCEDINVDGDTFNCYLKALEEAKIIKAKNKRKRESTNNFIIVDIPKYDEWSKSNFYKAIEKYVIPFVK